MSLVVSASELADLRRELDAHPDVGPDERVRALADVAILQFFSAVVGVALFCVGLVAGFFLLWELVNVIDGRWFAALMALVSVALSMTFPVVGFNGLRALQRRRLRRALRVAQGRKTALLDGSSSGGSVVAVPSSMSSVR